MKTTVSRNRLLAGSFFICHGINEKKENHYQFKFFSGKTKENKTYSEELGIQLRKAKDKDLFKWFLASILLGAPIQESVAKRTFNSSKKYDLLSPQKILKAGWGFLVFSVMREGHYVRFDEKTSTQLLFQNTDDPF